MDKDNLEALSFDVDADLYDAASKRCKELGTNIEEMTAAFIKFCVIPENLLLVEAFLSNDEAKRNSVSSKVFAETLKIAKSA